MFCVDTEWANWNFGVGSDRKANKVMRMHQGGGCWSKNSEKVNVKRLNWHVCRAEEFFFFSVGELLRYKYINFIKTTGHANSLWGFVEMCPT